MVRPPRGLVRCDALRMLRYIKESGPPLPLSPFVHWFGCMSPADERPLLTYRTPLISRSLDTFTAFALGGGVGLLSLLFPFAIAAALITDAGFNPFLAIGLVLPLPIVGCRFAWSLFTYRFRGSVHFHARYLQLGDGPVAVQVPYGEVEEIVLPERAEGHWLKLRIGNRPIRVVLRRDDLRAALNQLTRLCDNAVVVDDQGNEFVSRDADVDRTLLVRERRQRRQAFGSVILTLVCTAILCGRVWVAAEWLDGNVPFGLFKVILLWVSIPLLLIMSCLGVVSTISSTKSARALRKERLSSGPERVVEALHGEWLAGAHEDKSSSF